MGGETVIGPAAGSEDGRTRMTAGRPGGLLAIGGTPVVRLAHLADEGCAEVWVKMEAANPTGSYKDRMALAMIEAAEADGRLRPGQLVVEYTGGSTGSSLAFVCAVKGYPLRIVSSDAFADEKIRTMRAFGADVELIPSPDGITPDLIPSMMRRAAEITAQTGAFATDQFNNTDMVDGYRRLGEELIDQLRGPPPISAFCSYVGTAGCFLGVSRALAAALPHVHRVVVEPAESAVLSGGPPGTHHIEGGGIGHRPPQLHPADYDEVVAIPEAQAFQTARQAARAEGIFSGPSTGANLAAAVSIAGRLGPGHRVVTVQVDSGLKYLTGQLYSQAPGTAGHGREVAGDGGASQVEAAARSWDCVSAGVVRRLTASAMVAARGGQGNRGREIRRLTIPCSCCHSSSAVRAASGSSGVRPRHGATPSTKCCHAFCPGIWSQGTSSPTGSGLVNVTW